MRSMRTLRIRTIHRACSCPLDFAKFAAYRGNRPHPVALDADRFCEIVPGNGTYPQLNLESHTYAVKDRSPMASEILLFA